MKRTTALIGSLLIGVLMSAPALAQPANSARHMLNEATGEVSDAALTTKVKTVLETNKVARRYKIDVDSNHGTVTLKGHVGSAGNASYIAQLAQNVHGVKQVDNELKTP
jgi:osmotically-inducible protein OsmY